MKTFDLKDAGHFRLVGSDVLSEPGFHRFSASERERIGAESPEVAWHSLSSAGIQAKFRTDSEAIVVRVRLSQPANMEYMSAVGQCGVDLYRFEEETGEFVLHDVSRFDFRNAEYEASLGHSRDGRMRRYVLNLPLYAAADGISLSFDDEAKVLPDAFSVPGRILVYGTSIVQGGCVSRPGMLYTNLLSRWMDKEFLNFGFSGAGLGEKTVASILSAREDLDLLVVDIEANAGTSDLMEKRLPAFLGEFRKRYPVLPILLVSRPPFAMDWYDEGRIALRNHYDGWLKKLAAAERKKGQNVSYLEGSRHYPGSFTEYTVDGIHPSDLGAMEIAKAHFKALRKILGA